MASDALVPWWNRLSASMALTVRRKWALFLSSKWCKTDDDTAHMVGISVFLGFPYMVSISHLNVNTPDSNVHGANMGPIWGRQEPGGPHVGPMNFPIWDHCSGYDIAVGCYGHCIVQGAATLMSWWYGQYWFTEYIWTWAGHLAMPWQWEFTAITVCQSINYLYDFKAIFL